MVSKDVVYAVRRDRGSRLQIGNWPAIGVDVVGEHPGVVFGKKSPVLRVAVENRCGRGMRLTEALPRPVVYKGRRLRRAGDGGEAIGLVVGEGRRCAVV